MQVTTIHASGSIPATIGFRALVIAAEYQTTPEQVLCPHAAFADAMYLRGESAGRWRFIRAWPKMEADPEGHVSEKPETAWESVYCCRPYHACWILGLRNPAFDKSTDGRLLDFKDGQDHAVTAETVEFRKSLGLLALQNRILLAVVPGHKARDTNAGTPLARVVENLAKGDSRFVSSFETLIRYRDIQKLASGGDRGVAVHLASIRVQQSPSVKGETMIVLDDITTTGNSMDAARQLLALAGAIRIGAIALGRTVGS